MKTLVAAALIMLLLLGGWAVFLFYADQQSQELTREIQNNILPDIAAGSWSSVQVKMEQLNHHWHKFRKPALYLLHTDTINAIDFAIARSIKYADAEDVSNTAGELNAVIEQLSFLTDNQKLTLQNIL